MRITLPRVIAVALLTTATGSPFAEDFQCHDDNGCVAHITSNGVKRIVVFRKGDIVNTNSGWVVQEKDGWVPVPSPKEQGAEIEVR